jgi:hypothetical protein
MWDALSDERTVLSFSRDTISSNTSVVSMYNLHYMLLNAYIIRTRPLSVLAQYSRSCLLILVAILRHEI